jgi:hypothetical protein
MEDAPPVGPGDVARLPGVVREGDMTVLTIGLEPGKPLASDPSRVT